MAWVKIDDQFDEHPKLAAVGPLGWGVWLAGLAYCNRNLTDGFIPWNKARLLASFDVVEGDGKLWSLSRSCGMMGEDIDAEWVIGVLVDAGIWDEVQGGYQIHDYEDYQPTKAQVLAEREKKQAAGRAGGQASAQARAQAPASPRPKQNASRRPSEPQAKSNPVPVPVPDPHNGEANASPTRKRARKAAKAKEPTLTPDQLDRFERWYQHWPRKENRAKAEESWAAIDPDDDLVDKMIVTTQTYARSEKWREQGGKFIPHPATWLNNARWNDEPPKVDPPLNITPFQNNGRKGSDQSMSAYDLASYARELERQGQ